MRGVIMETKNGRAVLLTKGGGFVNIKDKGYSIGDKINITSNTGRLCAMAASLVIVCAGIGSYFLPAGYVSVDINPSLMMTLNVYNRVIDVRTFNDDARVLLNKADIKGKSAKKSVEMLINASEEIGYINDNNRDVILEVVPGMIRPDMERIDCPDIELINEFADKETLRMAQNIGISMAKVKAIEEYTEKNGGDMRSNADKFNDKSVKEIRNIIIDNGHLSDEKTADIIPEPAKPNERRADGFKHREIVPFGNQSPQNGHKPPENISAHGGDKPPEIPLIPNEPHYPELVPANNQTQITVNNVPPKKPINEAEQEFQSMQTEPKPQDRNSFHGGGKPEFSKPMEPVHENNVPPVNPQQSADEKPQGDEPDEPNRGDNNSEKPEENPNNEINQGKEDLTDNPQPEKKSDISELTTDKWQNNPPKPNFDEQSQNNPQINGLKHEDLPPHSNPQPNEPPHKEIPPRSEPQKNGGNSLPSGDEKEPSQADEPTEKV